MVNYLRIKKRYIFIFLLLISNQFLSKGHTSINRKLFKDELHKNTNLSKNNSLITFPYEQFKNNFYNNFQYKKIYNLNTLKFLAQNVILNQESEQTKNKDQDQDYKENTVFEEQNNKSFYEYLKNKYITNTDKNIDGISEGYREKSNLEKPENESFYKDLINNYTTNINTKDKDNSSDKKEKVINKIPLPSQSEISASEFKVPSRGYVKLIGPAISLNLQKADSFETLKLIGQLGNYGIIFIEENDDAKEESKNNPKITANFDNVNISDVFNSILLSANMQAIV